MAISFFGIHWCIAQDDSGTNTFNLLASDAENYESVLSNLSLSDEALELLEANGFVVTENPLAEKGEDIKEPYDRLKRLNIPIFVTSDSLLHMYHIQFGEILRKIEEEKFYDDLWVTSKYLLDEALDDYRSSTGEAKEAARRNVAYFSVGLSLLKPREDQACQAASIQDTSMTGRFDLSGCDNTMFTKKDLTKYSFQSPGIADQDVKKELDLIDAHSGFCRTPIFKYGEDYSQYVPRGYYSQSEKLKNYFRAMMWYGRLSFLLKGCDNPMECSVSAEDARIQTMGASMIAQDLKADQDAFRRWESIYNVTSIFVGYSDDLGPYQYIDALNSVLTVPSEARFMKEKDVEGLKAELAAYPSPRIYGGTGNCIIEPPYTPEMINKCLDSTKGFRLMGQRFIPDSYIFQNLVYPSVGKYTGRGQAFTLLEPYRAFPRGLDVMALLGSDRAEKLLGDLNDSSYENYEEQQQKLRAELDSLSPEEWQKNLYWGWLYALKPLLQEHGDRYPHFMRTEAWQDKQLTTALASWTELRHDTILYAKQSYTRFKSIWEGPSSLAPAKQLVGYVEPVPEFYIRLLALTNGTKKNLDQMGVLDQKSRNQLENLEEILLRLARISTEELEGKELSEEDYDFIENFGSQLDSLVADVDDNAKRTAIVADVHTDPNTLQALEEGVGYVRLMVVAYQAPDSRTILGAGPVFSYYEFMQPMDDRLTDERWREMLGSKPPEKPEWDSNFAVQ